MNDTTIQLGIAIFALLLAWELITGKVKNITREEQPIPFWFAVGITAVALLAFVVLLLAKP